MISRRSSDDLGSLQLSVSTQPGGLSDVVSGGQSTELPVSSGLPPATAVPPNASGFCADCPTDRAMAIYGYARISTIGQDLSLQRRMLRWPAATYPGRKGNRHAMQRPELLQVLLDFSGRGDGLVAASVLHPPGRAEFRLMECGFRCR